MNCIVAEVVYAKVTEKVVRDMIVVFGSPRRNVW